MNFLAVDIVVIIGPFLNFSSVPSGGKKKRPTFPALFDLQDTFPSPNSSRTCKSLSGLVVSSVFSFHLPYSVLCGVAV